MDVADAMSALTMLIVARTLFGADRVAMKATAERISAAIHVLQAAANQEFQAPLLLPEWLPTAMNRKRRAARQVLYETIDHLIAQRRAQGDAADSGDLLSMLLLSRDEAGDRMSDDEVRDLSLIHI